MIDDWFWNPWLDGHMTRHPRSDWPRADEAPEFYRGWRHNFVLHGIQDFEVAVAASERLMATPPRYLEEHLPALIDSARGIYRERAERGQGGDPSSRETAERASLGCDDCLGQGLTVRWRTHRPDHPAGPFITLYCRCPMGRWLVRTHSLHAPETRKHLYDLADHSWLWGDEYRRPPGAGTHASVRDLIAAARDVGRRVPPPAGERFARVPRGGEPQGPNVALGPDGGYVVDSPPTRTESER